MRIEVNGIPAPQGSKRHVGNGRMVESSRAVAPWREAVRAETQRAIYVEGQAAWGSEEPVGVIISFRLPRPKSAPARIRLPAKRPDVDKLARAVLDGLVAGGAFPDDAQVVQLLATKVYAGHNPPGAVISVRSVR